MDINSQDKQTQEAWKAWVNFTKAMTWSSVGTSVFLLLLALLTV